MRIGVPKENAEGELRVALVPDVVKRLVGQDGHEVVIESGAGEASGHVDAEYADAGAEVVDADAAWGAEVVLRVAKPSTDEISKLDSGQVVIGFLEPLTSGETTRALASAGVTSFAVESIPRTTRAQSMDGLSSQGNVAGYIAVLIANERARRLFPMMTTAAGTVAPAKVLVLGAGVAGLQAIATAKRLGATVTGFDVRPEVAEQVQSLGARFLEMEEVEGSGEGGYAKELGADEQERIKKTVGDAAARMDVIVTTAQIPGRPAPILITEDAVKQMHAGAVIVDLAGASGGNCECTEPGQTVVRHDVTIVSELNLPSLVAVHASQLYATNMRNLLGILVDDEGALKVDFDDDIVAGACITREGEIVNERAAQAASDSEGAS